MLEELRTAHAPYMRVVTHARNLGYGGALRSGFQAATREFVFYTDGDGQYDPGELPALLALAGPSTGLVNGYKLERHDPRHRVWIGSLYNFCARLLFRVRIRDIDCDYRLIRREPLEHIQSLPPAERFAWAGCKRAWNWSGWEVREVGVHHFPRLHGRSQFFRVRSLAVTFFQLLRLWVRLVVLR